MRRTGRWVFKLTAILSLALCFLFGLAWIRSYRENDLFLYWLKSSGTNATFDLGLTRGEIYYVQRVRPGGVIFIEERIPNTLQWLTNREHSLSYWLSEGWLHTQRYTLAEYQAGRPYTFLMGFRVPCSLLVAAAGIASVGSYAAARKLNPPTGRCPACGYDLRATPDRCPECGTIQTSVVAGRA